MLRRLTERPAFSPLRVAPNRHAPVRSDRARLAPSRSEEEGHGREEDSHARRRLR
jgi:hypothetical protein